MRCLITVSTQSLEASIRDILHRGAVSIVSEVGDELVTYCPFHSNMNTPSFSINRHTGLWQCFNPDCEKRGGVRLLQKLLLNEDSRIDTTTMSGDYLDKLLRGLSENDDVDDLERLLQQCSIDYTSDDVKLLDLMIDRGFELDTLKDFEVGFSRVKKRVVIPVRDQFFNLIGLIGRGTLSGQLPKYLYSSGFPRRKTLFNLNKAKVHDEVMVVEGSLDAMKIHQAGFPNVVATLGAVITKEQVQLLNKHFDQIVIIPDVDAAGFAMRDAIIETTRRKEVFVAACPEGFKDAGDMNTYQIIKMIADKKTTLFN